MPWFEDNSISHDITTDAGFRAWGSKIAKALAEVGLIQTADSGQINWTTVTTPAVNATYAGYEIWRFNDSAQSGQPIYMKVEYGRAAAASRPSIRMTYGRGSDGAGTLTKPSSTITHSPTANPSGNGLIYASFYKGAFCLISTALTSGENNAIFLHCERLRDPDLNPIDAFVVENQTTGMEQAAGRKMVFRGELKNGWELTENTEVAHLPSGTLTEETTIAARAYLVSPIPTAPFIGISGFFAGTVNSGDTGVIHVQGEDITYKRIIASERVMYSCFGSSGITSRTHNVLLPHME